MKNEEKEKPIPRDLRTPITEAGSALSSVCNIFVKSLGSFLKETGQDPEDYFFTKIFKVIWDDPEDDGDKEVSKFWTDFDQDPEETARFALLRAVLITTSFAVQAMKAKKNSKTAWGYASSAAYWSGIVNATSFGEQVSSEAASHMAKKRHAENYAMAEEALRYWQKNIDPKLSAQSAANELLRVVPLSHKKLAEIVSAAKRSVKTP
jgi:hypothetical protein